MVEARSPVQGEHDRTLPQGGPLGDQRGPFYVEVQLGVVDGQAHTVLLYVG